MGRCQLIFEEKTTLNYYYISGVGWGVCDTSSCQLTEAHLSKSSNWIGVQTGVHGFDSRTPHKPVVSKASETDIWLSSYDHLTEGRLSTTLAAKGTFFLLNQKEALKD